MNLASILLTASSVHNKSVEVFESWKCWFPKVAYYGHNVIKWLQTTKIDILSMNETINRDEGCVASFLMSKFYNLFLIFIDNKLRLVFLKNMYTLINKKLNPHFIIP